MPKRALITGVSGQDGSYLARFLINKNYEVHGTSRDAENSSFYGLNSLRIKDRVQTHSMDVTDFRSVIQAINAVEPHEIYHLAGQSSVGLSYSQPVATLESIINGTLNILEAIRFTDNKIRFYLAASSESFGDTNSVSADELTPFRPKSPYAVAKAAAYWQVVTYREAYDLFACSGISFNHESPLRPERFVTQKVVSTACKIAKGNAKKLRLGNLDIRRDWGWAPEYVEAMWLMLQQEKPDDFVIATGEYHSLEDCVAEAFKTLDLHWRKYVVTDDALFRPAHLRFSLGNPSKAEKKLQWRAQYRMKDVVRMMVTAKLTSDHY